MTLPVVWTSDANEDLLDARSWYDNIRPELGERFALAVESAIVAIAERPLQFPVLYRNRRRAGVRRRFPAVRHILRIAGASDCVIACFHGRRNPRRWQSR